MEKETNRSGSGGTSRSRGKGSKPGESAGSDRGEAAPKRKTSFARQRERRLQALVRNFELVSCVCSLYVAGRPVREILDEVRDRFPDITIKREDPGWILRWAALRGWLEFRPPRHDRYRQRLLDSSDTLAAAEVISSSEVNDIAGEAARMLIRMLRLAARSQRKVTVGVAGGHTMSAMMRRLPIEMARPVQGMPEIVHFRALAAGFIPDDPSTDPNAYVGFFENKLITTQLRFTGLSAPAIVSPEAIGKLVEFDGIPEAFESVPQIDIFVTSGSSWHKCGVLPQRLPETDQRILEKQNVVGDLLWRPISRNGPIVETKEISRRAFTLVELGQLAELIQQGKQVLLALAPCGKCRELKGELLWCALKHRLVTHLVTDTRSAGQMLGMMEGE